MASNLTHPSSLRSLAGSFRGGCRKASGLLVIWMLSATLQVHGQLQEFTTDLYRVTGSGDSDVSQVTSSPAESESRSSLLAI